MALRFIDGFDHYATADILKKWSNQGTLGLTIVAGAGRRGTAAMRVVASGSTQMWHSKILPDGQGTWILGFAFNPVTLPTADVYFVSFWDSAGSFQGELRLLTSGAIAYSRTPTILGTTTNLLSANVYRYLELRLVISNTVGEVELRIDGTPWLVLTGVDTQNSALANVAQLRIGNIAGSNALGTQCYDDLYLCDGTGAAPHNTFLGDVRIDTLLPTADGTHQQWTPSTPGTHYTLVDEAAPNTTDYVSSSTVGQRETYGMQDLTTMTGTIYGVQLNLAALKDDAGARSVKPLLLSGASEVLGTTVALSTSQTYTLHVQPTDPATSTAWTEVGINALQAGAEVA